MNKPNNLNPLHSFSSSEHGTPPEVIELAREVLEAIDLDPFSCKEFNRRVKSGRYFTKEDNSLGMAWIQPIFQGTEIHHWEPVSVFINPPSKVLVPNAKGQLKSKSGAKEAWCKLLREMELGHVTHAIFIAFSVEQLQTTQFYQKSLLDFPFCIPKKRLSYLSREGVPQVNGTHASAIIYIPNLIDNTEKFIELFSSIGKVVCAK